MQSGFDWPTLFKDARKFVLSCDECQRIGNIDKRQEMPMNYSLAVEPFDVWGFDYMGPFTSSKWYTHILVAVDYVTKWVEAIPTSSADCRCKNRRISGRGSRAMDLGSMGNKGQRTRCLPRFGPSLRGRTPRPA